MKLAVSVVRGVRRWAVGVGIGGLLCSAGATSAQLAPSVTYQGQLTSGGVPFNGTVDLKLVVYANATGGAQLHTQNVGGLSVTNGLMNAVVDLTGVDMSVARYLEISVHDEGDPGSPFVTLSPRQAMTPAPASLYSAGPWVTGANGLLTYGGPVRVGPDVSGFGTLQVSTAGTGSVEIGAFDLSSPGYPVYPIFAETSNPLGVGVYSLATAASGFPRAIRGDLYGPYGAAIEAYSFSTTGGTAFRAHASSSDGYAGVFEGTVSCGGSLGVGTPTPNAPLHVVSQTNGSIAVEVQAQTPGFGIYCETVGTQSTAIFGAATDTSGISVGVQGNTGGQWGIGVAGYSLATTGPGIGVRGVSLSPDGWAGFFDTRLYAGTFMSIQTQLPVRPLQVGDAGVAGTLGMARLASRAQVGSAGRTWDIGVPSMEGGLSGAAFGFVINDVESGRDPIVNPTFTIAYGSGYVGVGVAAPPNVLTLPNIAGVGGRGLANRWDTYSSERFKEHIAPISDASEIVRKLEGVRFDWKEGEGPRGDIGFIAERVNEVLPEVVGKDESGKPVSMDYGRLVPVTVEALKQQQGEIAALKEKLAERERVERELLERLERVEKMQRQ